MILSLGVGPLLCTEKKSNETLKRRARRGKRKSSKTQSSQKGKNLTGRCFTQGPCYAMQCIFEKQEAKEGGNKVSLRKEIKSMEKHVRTLGQ
jgi:hypothetical protein